MLLTLVVVAVVAPAAAADCMKFLQFWLHTYWGVAAGATR